MQKEGGLVSRWFHGTTRENAVNILNNGFNFGNANSSFGRGIYFSNNIDIAYVFTDGYENPAILSVEVQDTQIRNFTLDGLTAIFPEKEEEFESLQLEKYIADSGYSASSIERSNENIELVVYDKALIRNIKIEKYKECYA